MLTVVSSPVPVVKEPAIINELFESGLTVLHLRKPEWSKAEVTDLLKKINPKYYDQIALHQHHGLASDFGIRRLHHPEKERVKNAPMLGSGFIYSTSLHSLEKYEDLSVDYSYTFLGPVFNSISKTEYKEMDHKEHPIRLKNRTIKIIGIGGITKSNGLKALEYGFDGLALLGYIWLSEHPIINFKTMQKLWYIAGQL